MYKIPKKIEYKGIVYDVNATYNNILSIVDWLENGELDELDGAIMLVTKVFGIEAPVEQPLVEEALEIIRLGKPEEQHKQQVKDMDFIYDHSTIRMDIIREYGIDIDKEDVDWDWYVYAIENLGKDSVLNNKRMYRTVKLSDYKDPKQRKEIAKIKESVALPKEQTEETEEVKLDDTKINNILQALI